MNPLNQVTTTSEASKLWGLEPSTLRWAIRRNRFNLDEYRKAGKEWLILRSAMIRLYGPLRMPTGIVDEKGKMIRERDIITLPFDEEES